MASEEFLRIVDLYEEMDEARTALCDLRPCDDGYAEAVEECRARFRELWQASVEYGVSRGVASGSVMSAASRAYDAVAGARRRVTDIEWSLRRPSSRGSSRSSHRSSSAWCSRRSPSTGRRTPF